jgi:hypothetical protein
MGHLKLRSKLSALALMIANLIPLLGVLVWDWRIGDIMLLYWAESAVIEFYNLLKIQREAGWGIVFFGPFLPGTTAASWPGTCCLFTASSGRIFRIAMMFRSRSCCSTFRARRQRYLDFLSVMVFPTSPTFSVGASILE